MRRLLRPLRCEFDGTGRRRFDPVQTQPFAALRSNPDARDEPPTREPIFKYLANSPALKGGFLDGAAPNDHTRSALAPPQLPSRGTAMLRRVTGSRFAFLDRQHREERS